MVLGDEQHLRPRPPPRATSRRARSSTSSGAIGISAASPVSIGGARLGVPRGRLGRVAKVGSCATSETSGARRAGRAAAHGGLQRRRWHPALRVHHAGAHERGGSQGAGSRHHGRQALRVDQLLGAAHAQRRLRRHPALQRGLHLPGAACAASSFAPCTTGTWVGRRAHVSDDAASTHPHARTRRAGRARRSTSRSSASWPAS